MVELPESCPICGIEMKKGTLRTVGKGISIHWGPLNWGLRYEGEGIAGGLIKVDLIGSRCSKCKIIMFPYGKQTAKKSVREAS